MFKKYFLFAFFVLILPANSAWSSDVEILGGNYPAWIANDAHLNPTNGVQQDGSPAAVFVTFTGLIPDLVYQYQVKILDNEGHSGGLTYNDSSDVWVPFGAAAENRPYFLSTSTATQTSFYIFFRFGYQDSLLRPGDGQIQVHLTLSGGSGTASTFSVDVEIGDRYDMGIIEGILSSSSGNRSVIEQRMALAHGSGPFGFYPTEPNNIDEGYPNTPGFYRITVPAVVMNQLSFRDTDNQFLGADSSDTWFPEMNGVSLTENTTWDNSEVHIIEEPLIIPEGISLHIDPGTIVKLGENGMIDVRGELYANGEPNDSIFFTSINDHTQGGNTGTGNPQPGDWKKILFRPWSYGELFHASFLYGGVNESASGVIDIQESAPEIHHCRIAHNIKRGIFVADHGSPSIIGNNIEYNEKGGLFLGYNTNAFVHLNNIRNNTGSIGAGILCIRADPFISGNVISNNTATTPGNTDHGLGGGIACLYQTEAGIVRNQINGNGAVKGAGIYLQNSSSYVDENDISHNNATLGGGGIWFDSSSGYIVRNSIHRNTAQVGAAISFHSNNFDDEYSLVEQNTIADNLPDVGGSVIRLSGGKLEIVSTIIWESQPTAWLDVDPSNTELTLSYCSIPSFIPGDFVDIEDCLIGEDPLFVDPSNEDYSLQPESPCIDAGDPEAEPDLDGTTQDIGAIPNYDNAGNLPPQIDDDFWTEFPEDTDIYIWLDYHVEDFNDDPSDLVWQAGSHPNIEITFPTHPEEPDHQVARIHPNSGYWTPHTDSESEPVPDSILFVVTDPAGAADSAYFYFFIFPVPDPPTINDAAVAWFISINEDDSRTISLNSWLNNDGDNDFESYWWAEESDSIRAWVDYPDSLLNEPTLYLVPYENFHGAQTVRMYVDNFMGWEELCEIIVTVHSVNDPPIIYEVDHPSFNEDSSFTEQIDNIVFYEDEDHPPDSLTWTQVFEDSGTLRAASRTSNITVTIDQNTRMITFTPTRDWYGEELIILEVSDPLGARDTARIDVGVAPVNDPPEFLDIAELTFAEDSELIIEAGQLVQDVDDPLTDIPITVSDWDQTGLNFYEDMDPDDGSMFGVFFGTENWFGRDSLKLKVTDGLFVDSTIVYANIISVNDPPEISEDVVYVGDEAFLEDHIFTADLDTVVAFSDVDHSIDRLKWFTDENTLPEYLSVNVDSLTGIITLTPPLNWFGLDSLAVILRDPLGGRDTLGISIWVDEVNDPPQIIQDDLSLSFAEDESLVVQLDEEWVSDPDHPISSLYWDAGTATGVWVEFWQSENGLSIRDKNRDEDWNATFYSMTDWFGQDSMTLYVFDGEEGVDSVTVYLNVTPVNDPPVISGFEDIEMEEDSVYTDLDLDDYVSDIDHELSDLDWWVSDDKRDAGRVDFIGIDINYTTHIVTFYPDEDWFGSEDVTFVVSDPDGETDFTTVTVTVHSVNDEPIVDDQDLVTQEDTQLPFTLTGFDVEESALIFSVDDHPDNGVLTGEPPSLIYTPNQGYVGSDSLIFTAYDGVDYSDPGTIWITVNAGDNHQPIAGDQSVTLEEDSEILIVLTASDEDEDDDLSFSITVDPVHGDLIEDETRTDSWVYHPDENFFGPDSFRFVANDGQANSLEAAISITVNAVNDSPIVYSQNLVTQEDTQLPLTLTGFDVEDDDLSFSITVDPVHGDLIEDETRTDSWVYHPDENFFGPDSFRFVANDGQANSLEAAISITVNAGDNHQPIAQNQAVTLPEDSTVIITLSAMDVDDDDLTYRITEQPAHGSLVEHSGSRSQNWLYSPGQDYYGADLFQFVANDGFLDSEPKSVAIGVTAVNDAPVIEAISNTSFASGDTLAVDISISDVEDPLLQLNIEIEGNNWTEILYFSLFQTRLLLIGVNETAEGKTDTLTVTVTDNEGLSSERAFLVTIDPAGDLSGDHTLDEEDVMIVNDILLGAIEDPTPEEIEQADMNGDGILNVADIILMIDLMGQNR